ncbi:MAG: outer membrane beta-barrel protein [Edaphobacter sp.]|uniref:outer membrane beta-barrel protein n=1 Tax=Edaphobacter sp. TaxID=1934404 RepID=UPI0023A058F6|nr:outer membrane beta-barrel protein [Edaphobacter sp.]MDE1175826.1 outer membrane beta-barrel protein [Edaphobacter sp.]
MVLYVMLRAHPMYGQAEYTAIQKLDLQAGGSFSIGRSNYLPWDTQGNPAPLSDLTRKVNLLGGGAYLAADFRPHIGVEFNFHHLNGSGNGGKQTTYEVGGRYILTRRYRFIPYGRVSYGRGVYDYPSGSATLSFNLMGIGGGLDYHLSRSINLRADYEWQKWINVPLRTPNPQALTIGVAYHFH